MKLYLSSFKFGDIPQKLAALFSENKHIAMIPNARDFYHEEKRTTRIVEEKAELHALGLEPEEIDLRNYFGKKDKLFKDLERFGGVWIMGGNTFILRRAMEASGFDEWVQKKQKDQDFIYAGYSAGICVLAPTLKGVEIVDNPFQVPEGYEEVIPWNGLGILSYSPAPHYLSDHPESPAVNYSIAYMEKQHIPYKTLRDGEVIIDSTNI